MSARNLALATTLIALTSAAVFQARVIVRQREELRDLQRRLAYNDRLAARLGDESEAARRELEAVERELTARPSAAAIDTAAPGRRTETDAWLARVRQLRRHFDERADQRIPEMQWLTDDDWLRVARRASFDDEHGTRKAIGDLRSTAKSKFFARLAPAFRAFARTAGAEPPSSILALAPHFEESIEPATLQRYEITRRTSNSGAAQLLIREKEPIDADYDSRTEATANADGSVGIMGTNAPFAWFPDFREHTQRAYRAYSDANQGARPTGILQALPYFNPPLDIAKIELIRRFEQERKE
jgi:hypothetical protein